MKLSTWEVTSTQVQKHSLSAMLFIWADSDLFSNSNALALNSDCSACSFNALISFCCLFSQQKNLSCSLSTYASCARLLSAIASVYAFTSAKSFFIWDCSCSKQSPWKQPQISPDNWNEGWWLTLVLSPAKRPQSQLTRTAKYCWSFCDSVIIMVVWYDFCLTLFFIFAKSNSSHPLVDLIFLLIIYSRDTYLILPITSRSLSHVLYLSSKTLVYFYDIIKDKGTANYS